MRLYYLAVLFLFFLSCNNQKKNVVTPKELMSVNSTVSEKDSVLELEVYTFDEFEKFLNKKDGKVHVINFWATWCAPCIKELPYFEELNKKYKDKNVEVLLVSLDFPHLYESKLKPFIINKKIKSKVIALDDPDMNSWIPKVGTAWSGSIPATVIYKNNDKKFYEGSFTFSELETELKQFLN
ncbi:TlpA family protein disulfide reductase [Aestuariivivens insulae]|uniref:TlpA family protein disulfide reductase n=1 Tax=Aestuariivivens insulae TaxID=1621988 RepID=UPI001F59B88A|nr:TlpA family protein disulfide reductase [Aestuariivivens insulae]